MVAALFVDPRGTYASLPVDCWGIERDARLFDGPGPVIAHPPCERWGAYANGGPGFRGAVRPRPGEDGGCFASALRSVERFGGVLEHPRGSKAWGAFGLMRPDPRGGWVATRDGWTCCVEQGRYGHRAKKATWLYVVGRRPPELDWGITPPDPTLTSRQKRTGICQRLSRKQRASTPPEFAALLLSLCT